MKKIIPLLAILITFSACSTTTPQLEHPSLADAEYAAWMDDTTQQLLNKSDSEYRRIPINSDEQSDHFFTLTHQAFRKEITKQQYIDEMNAKYPGYEESIQWNADQLPE